MRPTLSVAAALAVATAALLLAPAAGWRTRGAVESLPPACGADLDALLEAHYPDVKLPSGATAPSECGAAVREALHVNVTAKCPDEATLVACFSVRSFLCWEGGVVDRMRQREGWAERWSHRFFFR